MANFFIKFRKFIVYTLHVAGTFLFVYLSDSRLRPTARQQQELWKLGLVSEQSDPRRSACFDARLGWARATETKMSLTISTFTAWIPEQRTFSHNCVSCHRDSQYRVWENETKVKATHGAAVPQLACGVLVEAASPRMGCSLSGRWCPAPYTWWTGAWARSLCRAENNESSFESYSSS